MFTHRNFHDDDRRHSRCEFSSEFRRGGLSLVRLLRRTNGRPSELRVRHLPAMPSEPAPAMGVFAIRIPSMSLTRRRLLIRRPYGGESHSVGVVLAVLAQRAVREAGNADGGAAVVLGSRSAREDGMRRRAFIAGLVGAAAPMLLRGQPSGLSFDFSAACPGVRYAQNHNSDRGYWGTLDFHSEGRRRHFRHVQTNY
jgi:hypothetical protein